jgi:L-galactose dehydrogenase
MSSNPKLPSRPLGRSGLEVSVLAFGASPLGGVFQARARLKYRPAGHQFCVLINFQTPFESPVCMQPIDEEEGIRAVEAAFQRGINFFDTSPFYGDTRSETVLGKALKRLPRDKIVVATKVGRYGQDTFDFSASRVTASIQESLTRLQLEYVDLVQCHDIEFGDLDQIIEETLPALAKLREKGIVKNVGITGLPLKIFTYILDR